MIWFDRLFPVFMIAHPLVFALFVKTRMGSDVEVAKEARRWMGRLALATACFLIVHVGVQALLESTQPSRNLPRAVWPVLISVFSSLLLWLVFAGRAIVAKNAAFQNVNAVSGVALSTGGAQANPRSASLVPRHLADPISRQAWMRGWLLFVACMGLSIWAVAAGASPVLLLGAAWWIGMAVGAANHNLTEPEPRDAGGAQQVADAYQALRTFRSWCFYVLGLTGTVCFTSVAVLELYWPWASGILGTVVGSSLGIGGALFGALAAVRRARINGLLLDAQAQASD